MRRESEPPGNRKHSGKRAASGAYISDQETSGESSSSSRTISSIRRGVKTGCRNRLVEANQPKSASQLASKASQRRRDGGSSLPLGNVSRSRSAAGSGRGVTS